MFCLCEKSFDRRNRLSHHSVTACIAVVGQAVPPANRRSQRLLTRFTDPPTEPRLSGRGPDDPHRPHQIPREDQSRSARAGQASGRVSRSAHGFPDHFAGRYDRDSNSNQRAAREVAIEDALAIPDNLILRAAHAVLDEMKISARVRFRLAKTHPDGRRTRRRVEQCGGGAAWRCRCWRDKVVPMERLIEIGAELGSDVPFFLHGGTAMALGPGRRILSPGRRRTQADSAGFAGCSCRHRTGLSGPGPRFDFHRFVK